MNNIPQSSQASLLQGYWFIFNDGDREIAVYGAITGKEQIFINKHLISEKRSLKMTSRHQFTLEENVYEVVFHIPNILAGKMDCSLHKDGLLLEHFKTKVRKERILGYVFLAAVIGFFFGYGSLTFWPTLILLVFLIAFFATRKTRDIVINREVGSNA